MQGKKEMKQSVAPILWVIYPCSCDAYQNWKGRYQKLVDRVQGGDHNWRKHVEDPTSQRQVSM